MDRLANAPPLPESLWLPIPELLRGWDPECDLGRLPPPPLLPFLANEEPPPEEAGNWLLLLCKLLLLFWFMLLWLECMELLGLDDRVLVIWGAGAICNC